MTAESQNGHREEIERLNSRPEISRSARHIKGRWSMTFNRFAAAVAFGVGHPIAFIGASGSIAVWALLGPAIGYSSLWIYAFSLTTSIITFLMTFVIMNTQNRDGLAAQLKLDELIRAVAGARNAMINIEGLTDEQLAGLQASLAQVANTARQEGDLIAEKLEERQPVAASPATVGHCASPFSGPSE